MLHKQLVDQFVERGYTWMIDGKLRPPTYTDMKEVLDQANEKLDDGMQMEFGRLIFVKSDGHLDVYMFQGDYNDA